MILILSVVLFTTAKGYCQQGTQEQGINTIAGTVTYMDAEGAVVSVKTDKGTMDFNIPAESDLLRKNHHIVSIEIQKGDPVIVQYTTSPFGKNILTKLVDMKPDSV